MYYSKSNNAFYDETLIYPNGIPSDCIKITAEEHKRLLNLQSQGKVIKPASNGKPTAVDRPAPTKAELQVIKNINARNYLADTDWYVTRFLESGVAIPEEITRKRRIAREQVIE